MSAKKKRRISRTRSAPQCDGGKAREKARDAGAVVLLTPQADEDAEGEVEIPSLPQAHLQCHCQ